MNDNISFEKIINLIETRKYNAYRKVNEELIMLYWGIGKYLYELTKDTKYGDKTITKVVDFMKENYPNIKGFTRRGIYRMIQFYETYKNDKNVSPLVTQLSWTNNLLILSSCKSKEERYFYLQLSIENNYFKRELERQIKSSYYERYMLSNNSTNLPINNSRELKSKILDIYSLEFLKLKDNYSEKELRKSIINNLKMFILEVGKSYSFIGEEYKINIDNVDYYIDLLFYNRDLSCLIAFELKVGKFKPEYVSKMNFYLETLDKNVKKDNENPSIGIILCNNKNEEVVKYALNRNLTKPQIALYYTKLIDKKLLQNKLKELNTFIEENV